MIVKTIRAFSTVLLDMSTRASNKKFKPKLDKLYWSEIKISYGVK